jgi:uncharacterized protein YjbJ (UPF0337 family)
LLAASLVRAPIVPATMRLLGRGNWWASFIAGSRHRSCQRLIVTQEKMDGGPDMKDKTEGKWDEAKGKIKEETGKVTGDRSTEISGKADQVKGKVKEGIGELKEEVAEEKDRTETPR